MDVKEYYNAVGGDYNDVLSRLGSEGLIKKLIKKFPNDDNMSKLESALAARNFQDAFAAAHTLKGVALSLGLKSLGDPVAEITELVRGGKEADCSELLKVAKEKYDLIVSELEKVE